MFSDNRYFACTLVWLSSVGDKRFLWCQEYLRRQLGCSLLVGRKTRLPAHTRSPSLCITTAFQLSWLVYVAGAGERHKSTLVSAVRICSEVSILKSRVDPKLPWFCSWSEEALVLQDPTHNIGKTGCDSVDQPT